MKSDKNIREGYKRTAVGVIPEEWEVKRLGDIGEVINGLTYSPKDVNLEGTLVLRSSNVQNRTLSFDDNVYVNTEELQYNPVKKDDILICVRNGSKNLIGKNALITKNVEDIAFGAFMSVYRSSLNSYIFQFFGTHEYQRQINRNLGATINSINNSELRDFKLPIPPLPEQQAIANCLTTWDSGIEKLTQLIAAKREQKKGLMQQLLTGKKRLDGFVGEWKEVRLKDISKITKGKQLNRNELDDSSKYPSYSGGIEPSGYTNKYNCKANTIIISEGGNSCGFVNYIDVDFWLGGHCYSINNIKVKVDKLFLYNILKYNQTKIMMLRVGSGLPNVQKKDLERFKLTIPSIEEQQALAEILTTADQEISLLEAKLAAMKEEKKGLMQVLLTGEKRLIDS